MIDNLIAVLCRNLLLALLDDLIDELNNFASLSAEARQCASYRMKT